MATCADTQLDSDQDDGMADLVFNAASKSASASASSSRFALATNESTHGEFGAIQYERVLTLAECAKLERTTQKLGRLDPFVHVWVHDARTFRHGKESDMCDGPVASAGRSARRTTHLLNVC